MSATLTAAKILWDFLGTGRSHGPSDLLVVCGSYDLRVVEHASHLLQQGVAPHVLFSGALGKWTELLWQRSEAEIFAEYALQPGVPAEHISLETQARNFGENLAFSCQLFPDVQRVTFITKPNSIARVALTQPIQWPGITSYVDAPAFAFPEGVSQLVGVIGVIDELVGDIERIRNYPALGYQQPRAIPDEVHAA
jgi:uncharacterized SAM-binding protein YcdF (DUF218 family)